MLSSGLRRDRWPRAIRPRHNPCIEDGSDIQVIAPKRAEVYGQRHGPWFASDSVVRPDHSALVEQAVPGHADPSCAVSHGAQSSRSSDPLGARGMSPPGGEACSILVEPTIANFQAGAFSRSPIRAAGPAQGAEWSAD